MVAPELRRRAQQIGRLSVRRNGLFGKVRVFYVVPHLAPPHNLGVYNNNVDTVERALVERYFLCKDGDAYRPALQVRPRAFCSPGLMSFKSKVQTHMPNLPVLTRSATVDLFRGSKRRVYEAAEASLMKDPVCEQDARLTSFAKFEKLDVSKAPRLINPRSPRYNLELARYLKHAEHHFFRAINKAWGARTRATVIKGFDARVSAAILRDKWNCFTDPVAVGLDATKFDMHVSVQALRYEHSFYTALFPGQQRLKRLLQWQLLNRGTAYCTDGTVKFEMRGTRSSGDMNTSLGNCILMCAMVRAWCDSAGVDAELANNGDDCVVIMERGQLERFLRGCDGYFRRLGFAMTVEPPVFEFEEIEFCQTHPVLTVNGWVMVRNHATTLQKDLMCLIPVANSTVYQRWLGAVGEGGLAATHGVPVQQDWYAMIRRCGIEPRAVDLENAFKNTSQLYRAFEGEDVITPEARVSYYCAFGVLPDEQRELERLWTRTSVGEFTTGTPSLRETLAFTGHPLLRGQVNGEEFN